jgi:hypothetical protein
MCESRERNHLLTLGLIALAVANVGSYLVQRKLGLSESVADPVSGFLYGVAIMTTLLGIRRQMRARNARH